jgi:hypothetical protein
MITLPPLKWVPSPNFSGRGGAHVDLLVLHDTEGSYQSAISWFAMRQSQVSAHFVVREDGGEATQMVDIGMKAWHACNVNPRSIGVEMAGISAKGFAAAEIQTLADIFAFHLLGMEIPCRHALNGQGPGFCSHFETGMLGGGHSDPSTKPEWMANFAGLVSASYAKGAGAFPPVWQAERGLAKLPCCLYPGH